MREKLAVASCNCYRIRITPASAGKTLTRKAQEMTLRDHPRECGKNELPIALRPSTTGSPPRVREKTLKDPIEIANPD